MGVTDNHPVELTVASTRGRWVLVVAVLGSGMAFLDGTVVNVALPTIGRDLGVSASGLQWILNGYLLSLASLILLGGSLGDRYGRRRVFVLGVGLFATASLLCAVAPGSGLLIAARLLQGIGGALLTPASLAMIEATFRPVDRARAIGAWSGLTVFASRQFTAANLVTFVVYAALAGVFFLLVAFLQIAMGYSAVAAGAASLPVTTLMLIFSARAGALAQRIGPRIPLSTGPLVIAAGLLLMTRISPGDTYVSSVLPAVVVFGGGLTLVVAPVTATVLAAVDARHAGIASGINNAVARVGGLLSVAVLPLVAGLTGDGFLDPEVMAGGFRIAMAICAALAAAGGALAWSTISSDVLEAEPALRGEPPVTVPTYVTCAIAGPPLHATGADAPPVTTERGGPPDR